MNKTNQLNEIVLDKLIKSTNTSLEGSANLMWGYYRGLLNVLERNVPGVAEALEDELNYHKKSETL